MASSKAPYYDGVRKALNLSLCIQNFPCQNVERHNKPEIEFQ
jgi:actin related protein 2/3 complex subunit 4